MRLKDSTLLARVLEAGMYPEIAARFVSDGIEGARSLVREVWAREKEQLVAHMPNRKRSEFVFDGKAYRYLDHEYNSTRVNERCVEIPLFTSKLEWAAGSSVLELGNVLSHYIDHRHTVVDKYEIAEGVINVDILDYFPSRAFDMAVSISTLEHIGWDYPPRDPALSLVAILRLLRCLAPWGTLIASVPIGHNAIIDEFVLNSRLRGGKFRYLRRISPANEWIECARDEANQPYVNFVRPYVRRWTQGPPFPFANAICVFEIPPSEAIALQELIARVRRYDIFRRRRLSDLPQTRVWT